MIYTLLQISSTCSLIICRPLVQYKQLCFSEMFPVNDDDLTCLLRGTEALITEILLCTNPGSRAKEEIESPMPKSQLNQIIWGNTYHTFSPKRCNTFSYFNIQAFVGHGLCLCISCFDGVYGMWHRARTKLLKAPN